MGRTLAKEGVAMTDQDVRRREAVEAVLREEGALDLLEKEGGKVDRLIEQTDLNFDRILGKKSGHHR